MKRRPLKIIVPKAKQILPKPQKETQKNIQIQDILIMEATKQKQKCQNQTSDESGSDLIQKNKKNSIETFSEQKQMMIENLKIKLSLNKQKNDSTLKLSEKPKNGFIPYRKIDQEQNQLQLSLEIPRKQLEKEPQEQNDQEPIEPIEHNEITTPRKKKNRRNLNEVKDSYRCFCGKNFVSYPGIYIHLKEKHLKNKENKKFFIKTFKHKVTGDKIKQVVLQETDHMQMKSELSINNQQGVSKRNLQKNSKPVVLEILDDDDKGEQVIEKGLDVQKERKEGTNQERQSMKQYMQKYVKLTCQYKELLERFLISQRQQIDKEKQLSEQLKESRLKVRELEQRNKCLQEENRDSRSGCMSFQSKGDKNQRVKRRNKFQQKGDMKQERLQRNGDSMKTYEQFVTLEHSDINKDKEDGEISLNSIKSHYQVKSCEENNYKDRVPEKFASSKELQNQLKSEQDGWLDQQMEREILEIEDDRYTKSLQ